MYLWFLIILVVYDPYLVLRNSTATCTYLLLRCLLSDRYSNIVKNVILLFLLITKFLLLSIIILFKLFKPMAELIVIVQVGCLCVGGWEGGTFVRMCVSNFLFTLRLSLVFKSTSSVFSRLSLVFKSMSVF